MEGGRRFEAIISESGPGKCGKVLLDALTLVKEESKKLLLPLKTECEAASCCSDFLDTVLSFCWLFDQMREGNAAQAMVEHILKDEDIAPLLQAKLQRLSSAIKQPTYWEMKWATMMCRIFRDILDGRLFLTSLERLAFFKRWNYFFKADTFDSDSLLSATLVSSFILTFPYEDQEEIYRRWVSSLNDPAQQADRYDLSEAHSLWMTYLVSKALKLDAPKRSRTGGDSEPADGECSGSGIQWLKDCATRFPMDRNRSDISLCGDRVRQVQGVSANT